MLILTPAQTAEVLPYRELVPAIEDAALQLANNEINAPERQVIPIDSSSVLLTMPAIASDVSVTKIITVHSSNAQHRLPSIQGEVIVFDTMTGKRLAMLDGPTVTARRTAAVTLTGVQKLALAKPASAVLIGTGVQAQAHADALIEFLGIAQLWITSRDKAHADAFCESLIMRHPQITAVAINVSELHSYCLEVDLIVAMTTARSPVIPELLQPKTLAVGVGAFKPDMAELPPSLLHARPIVVDHLAGARHEAGDLIQAGVAWEKVRDLASVLTDGAGPNGVAPIFKTIGHAAWDLAAARVAIRSCNSTPTA